MSSRRKQQRRRFTWTENGGVQGCCWSILSFGSYSHLVHCVTWTAISSTIETLNPESYLRDRRAISSTRSQLVDQRATTFHLQSVTWSKQSLVGHSHSVHWVICSTENNLVHITLVYSHMVQSHGPLKIIWYTLTWSRVTILQGMILLRASLDFQKNRLMGWSPNPS